MFMEVEFLPFAWKIAPLALGVGVVFPTFGLLHKIENFNSGFFLEDFFSLNWFFDELSNFFALKYMYTYFYTVFFIILDRGLLEYIGPFGFIAVFAKIARAFAEKQTGFLFHYAFMVIVGLAFVVLGALFFIFSFSFEVYFVLICCFFFFLHKKDFLL